MSFSFSCNIVSNKNQKELLLTGMVFSLKLNNTIVDGNGITSSLSCVPHKRAHQ
jgi:hypothetical protein